MEQRPVSPSSRKSHRRGVGKRAPREDLYVASEAISKLNLPKSTFEKLVREKKIPKEIPFGRKEGYYPKEFIDRLASHLQGGTSYKEMLDLLEQVSSKGLVQVGSTDWIQPGDLPYVLALDYEMYGLDDAVDMRITSKWWEKNPHQCRILFDKSDRTKIWGVLTVMPLPLPIIYQLLKQEMSKRDISLDDIYSFEPGNAYDGYIASAIIRPEHRVHFRMLIQSVLSFWCDQYPTIQLRRLYAYASTDEGFYLLTQLLFSPRYDLGENAFELDPMRRNRSRLVRSFQECIRAKEVKLLIPN